MREPEKKPRFNVGDRVTWRTRSNSPQRTGTVIEVDLYRGNEYVSVRADEDGELYHPPLNRLELISE